MRAPLAHAVQRARQRSRRRGLPPGPDAPATTTLGLTSRQREVLELVATGRTSAAIGRELGISGATVAKHLDHIYRVLQVSNRAAAVARSAAWDASTRRTQP